MQYIIAIFVVLGLAAMCYGPTGSEQRMRVSAYCPCKICCGEYADGITASGHRIEPGDRFVAAPKHMPFGMVLDVPGYGVVPVLDRGGSIKENRLDVYFDSHAEAVRWGVKWLEVRLN